MDVRLTWTDCDEAGDYVVPNVLSPRVLVFKPDNTDDMHYTNIDIVYMYIFMLFKAITLSSSGYCFKHFYHSGSQCRSHDIKLASFDGRYFV